jgi:ABC-type bacteriocin/lantibiotic exporter with double-glycine peptidase domain
MNEYKKIQKISFKERLKTLKLAYNWTYKAAPKLTITLLITSFFSGLFVIVSPYVYKVLIDYLTGLDLTTTTSVSMSIIVLIIIYVLIIFLSAFLSELNFLLKTTTNVRIEKYASSEIMNKASELDIEHFEDAEFYDNLYKANQSIPRIPDLYRFSTNTFKYLVSVQLFSVIFVNSK